MPSSFLLQSKNEIEATRKAAPRSAIIADTKKNGHNGKRFQ